VAPTLAWSLAPAAAGLNIKLCCVNWLMVNICCAFDALQSDNSSENDMIDFNFIQQILIGFKFIHKDD